MTLISLEDAKAEVRKVVSDFKTRYDINYRLNNLPSIELEEDSKDEPQTEKHKCRRCLYYDISSDYYPCSECVDYNNYSGEVEDEPQTEREVE